MYRMSRPGKSLVWLLLPPPRPAIPMSSPRPLWLAFTAETAIDGRFGSGPRIYDSNSKRYALGYGIGIG